VDLLRLQSDPPGFEVNATESGTTVDRRKIEHESIQSEHAALTLEQGRWWITPQQGSVALAGEPLAARCSIHVGDRVQLGELTLVVTMAIIPPFTRDKPDTGVAQLLMPGDATRRHQRGRVVRARMPALGGQMKARRLREHGKRRALCADGDGKRFVVSTETGGSPSTAGPRWTRFLLQAELEAGLWHEGLVHTLRATVNDDAAVKLEEYPGGEALQDVVARARARAESLPAAHMARVGADVAAALAYLHAGGHKQADAPIVHLGVAPRHVIVDAAGRGRLLGLDHCVHRRLALYARRMWEVPTHLQPFLAPEARRRCTKAGPPADTYALAATLAETLTGQFLAEPDDALAAARQVSGVLGAALVAALQPEEDRRATLPELHSALESQAMSVDDARELARAFWGESLNGVLAAGFSPLELVRVPGAPVDPDVLDDDLVG
jgi:hypothetical protein